MTTTRLFWLSIALLSVPLAACRQDATGAVDGDAYGRASSALVTTEAALEVSDDVLGFDPVLDRLHTADQNAMAVETHAHDSLTGCGTVTRTGTTITIDFGTAGCTTPSGHVVTGSIAVTIGAMSLEATASFAFTNVTIDGSPLGGTLVFTTMANRLSVAIALTSGTSSVSGNATVNATTGAFSLDASLTATRSAVTTSIGIAGLVWTRGDCYPGAGTVTATTGRLVQSITFTSASAMGGVVSVSEGPLTSTETLPAYGDCPMP